MLVADPYLTWLLWLDTYLVVVLEGLVIVSLHMEGSGQLVATLSLHGLHFSAMEGVESKVLDLAVVLGTKYNGGGGGGS